MLPWDDLKYVLAMHEHRNATAAARALGVNATTVTRRLASLEAHLGARLFDRGPNGATATTAGRAAVEAAKRIEDEVHNLDAEVRGLDRELRGTLRVTSMDIVLDLWREDLAALHREMPGVELRFEATSRPVDLGRREADVALRFSPAPPADLVGRRLTELFFAVYAAESLVERTCVDGPAPYDAYPWIGWNEPYAAATERIRARHARNAEQRIRVSTLGMLRRVIEDELGVSVLPCFFGDRIPGLVRLGPYFEGDTWLWALTHEHLRRTARVRAFLDAVAVWAERDKPLLAGERPAKATAPVA